MDNGFKAYHFLPQICKIETHDLVTGQKFLEDYFTVEKTIVDRFPREKSQLIMKLLRQMEYIQVDFSNKKIFKKKKSNLTENQIEKELDNIKNNPAILETLLDDISNTDISFYEKKHNIVLT